MTTQTASEPDTRASTDLPGGLGADYDHDEAPLGGYLTLAALFTAAMGVGLGALPARGRALPRRIPASDIVLIGVATHKVSRLITKDRVTSFLRGAVHALPRGQRPRRG